MKSKKLTEEELYQAQKHKLPKAKFKPLSKRKTESLLQFDPLKFFYHAETINELLQKGDVISPITLDVDPTNRCNQDCVWCSFDYLHRERTMLEEDIFLKLVTDLSEFKKNNGRGVRSMIFSGGGEPTLNPILPKIMEICNNSSIRCGIYTNGTFKSQHLREVILHSCDFIRFSIEASNKDLYDRLHKPRVQGAYEQVIKNIRKIVALKRRTGAGPDIGISFLVHPLNWNDVIRSAKQAQELGVDYFQVKPVIKKAWEHQDLTVELLQKVERLYDKVNALETENFKVIIVKQKLDDIVRVDYGRNYSRCLGHYLSSVITADAKVYICVEHRGLTKYEIGDLHEHSFYDIWNSPKRQEVIKSIDFNECQPGCKGHFRTLAIEHIKSIRHTDFI